MPMFTELINEATQDIFRAFLWILGKCNLDI